VRQYAPDSPSCPVSALAETHGIDRRYAFIIRDEMLLRLHKAPAGVWPDGHFWYAWAWEGAKEAHGMHSVIMFSADVADFYRHE